MTKTGDITITLPAEYFDAQSAVFSAGLKHANIKAEARKELQAWWIAESELIGDTLEDQ